MMQRKTKLRLTLTVLLVIAGALTVWLIWFRPSVSLAPEKRLLGSWEDNGKVSGELSVASGQGVPGGTASVTTDCTVQAEFKPDGTYVWKEQHKGAGISMSFWAPKEDGSPARWEVVSVQRNKLTVRIHSGDVVFDFQDENTFTMNLPESAKASGTLTFRRSGMSKQ
jgi:hypothetical protein